MNGDKTSQRPVVVAIFLHPNEAHIFRGLLESEGIESFVYHENAAMFMPVISGGVQVAVREADVERATRLLAGLREEWNAGGGEP